MFIGIGIRVFSPLTEWLREVPLIWELLNFLDTTATVGSDAPFTRGGSGAFGRSFDATAGLILVNVPADEILVEGMLWTGTEWVNNDGSVDSLHPVNASGIPLEFAKWSAVFHDPGSFVWDTVGNHNFYYQTALGGTSVGTGVADDTGVTDWVQQGRYSNTEEVPGMGKEPERENRLRSDFSGGWTSMDFAPGSVIAPDGTSTTHEFKPPFVADIGQSYTVRAFSPVATTAGDIITFSVFAKYIAGGAHYLVFSADQDGTFTYFNLESGNREIVADPAVSAKMEPAGGGWFRCSRTYTATATDVADNQFMWMSNRTAAPTMDPPPLGDEHIAIWEPQSELGDGKTSIIPTTTGPLTRPATSQTSTQILNTQSRFRFVSREAAGRAITFLSDGTRTLSHDGTNLIFTDGINTASGAFPFLADTLYNIGLTTAGKFEVSVDGAAIATDATATSGVTWTALTDIGTGLNGSISPVQATESTLPTWNTDVDWTKGSPV